MASLFRRLLRIQFSLALLISLLHSWGWPPQEDEKEQKRAINHLRSVGAKLTFEGDRLIGVSFFGSTATDDDTQCLASIDTLQWIDFGQRNFGDSSLVQLVELKDLNWLNLDLTHITDSGLEVLCKNRNLEAMDLSATRITQLKPLTNLPKLRKLSLQHCAIDDSQLIFLGQIPSLVDLDLNSTEVTDGGMKHLANLTNLEELRLAQARITDDSLAHLLAFPKLQQLQLAYPIGNGQDPGHCYLSALGLRRLRKKLGEATIFGNSGGPPFGTVEIHRKGQLETLDMSIDELLEFVDKSAVEVIDFSDTIVDDSTIRKFKRFVNLQSLNLRQTWITDAAFETIGQMSELRVLDVSDTRITDEGIQLLAMCSLLRKLNLENTYVNGRGFETLTDLTQLVDLDISRHPSTRWSGRFDNWQGLSDEGLELVSQIHWLDRLNLDGQSNLSPRGIRNLLRFSIATEIGIQDLSIDPKLETELHKALPRVTWSYRTDYRFLD